MTRTGNRRAAPVGVLVGLAAVPAVVLAGLWQYAEAEVPPATTTTTTTMPPPSAPPLTTDLLSYRRHPTPLAEHAAAEAAAAANAARVTALLDLVGDGSCVRIVDDDTVVAEEGGGVSVIPASNQKLFIAATALDVLGPDFRFRTELQSAPPVGGVVPGGVYLVGGGDPVLTTAGVADPQRYPAFNTTALETLADQLVALGITTIDGDVVGDGSRYDDEFRVDAWGDDITSLDAGPYDALLVNDGIISPGNYGLDPSRAAAREFFDLLIARGITVTGAAANAARPADAGLTTLALIESRPLTDVLVEMLHTSDNNTAEMLVKEIGYATGGQGTRQAGLDTVRATLDRWGVPLTGVDLRDGSGLDRANLRDLRGVDRSRARLAGRRPTARSAARGRARRHDERAVARYAGRGRDAGQDRHFDRRQSAEWFATWRRPAPDRVLTRSQRHRRRRAIGVPAGVGRPGRPDRPLPGRRGTRSRAFRTELTLGDPYYSTMGVMPMFPLGTPLLPGSVLPLHVFEPRYRQLVHDILADDSEVAEFGVVMIARGREVGGGDVRNDVGTVARVLDMRALPDGRYALAAVGADRLRVNAWLPDDPYPLADIDLWPDDDLERLELAAVSATIEHLHERVRAINDEVRALGEMTPPPDTEISSDPHLSLYHLGSLAPLGPADRQRMLEAATLGERLEVFAAALDDAAAVVRFRSA